MEYMSRNTADLVIIDPVLPGFPNAMAVPKSLSKPDEKARKIQRKFPQENHGEKTDSLSEREIEILGLLYQGHAKQSIADELCLSYHTVKTHTTNIYRKLNVHTRSAAVYKYFHEAG